MRRLFTAAVLGTRFQKTVARMGAEVGLKEPFGGRAINSLRHERHHHDVKAEIRY